MAGTVMIRRCFNDEVVAMTTGRCWAGRVARPTLGRRSAGAAGRTARWQRRAAITQSQAAAVCVRPDMSIYNIHASATTYGHHQHIYVRIYGHRYMHTYTTQADIHTYTEIYKQQPFFFFLFQYCCLIVSLEQLYLQHKCKEQYKETYRV